MIVICAGGAEEFGAKYSCATNAVALACLVSSGAEADERGTASSGTTDAVALVGSVSLGATIDSSAVPG